jgi:hypothetical protein
MTTSRPFRSAAVTAAVAVSVLALAACGSGYSSGGR